MSNEATPGENNGGNPPATPPVTPSVPAEMLSLPKEEVEQLRRDAARAATHQSKADRYDRLMSKGGGHFKPSAPVTPPSSEEIAERAAAEDRKAERGLLSIAADPAFREVLDKDPTLRNLLTANPLAVLPMLAPEALDAEDAVSLVKEALNKRKPAPALPATPPPAPATPPVGGVNPQDNPTNAEVEVARKNPNAERAIAGMIGARLKGMKK